MTLDEAIKHAIDKSRIDGDAYNIDCIECKAEHKKLAEWLQELKERRKKETYEINFDKELSIIVNHYQESQIIKLVEEMAELTQAIMKNINSKEKEDCESVLQEIADVEILLRQLFLRREKDTQARINGIKDFKIKRTLNRIYQEIR